ncbi:MAG: hypothetical protein J0L83_03630 [Chitinophagales bacterium]|nr:hypothetical protein [Chitinophagales bacterium]
MFLQFVSKSSIIVLFLLYGLAGWTQNIGYRKYKKNEKYRYQLTVETYTNGTLSSKEVSVSEHTVLKESRIYQEEIKWLSKIRYSGKDSTDFSIYAKSIKPYRISLAKNGKVLLPALSIPEMTGDITDLNTFFVAVSPALKMQYLSKSKTTLQLSEPIKGVFSDGIKILRGEDCTVVSQELLSNTDSMIKIRTNFSPPSSFCLTPFLELVSTKVFDAPNNFQMIQSAGNSKVNFLWGVESFSIDSEIESNTGKILHGTMTNKLQLKARINASTDLSNWQLEMPLEIIRKIELKILPPTND